MYLLGTHTLYGFYKTTQLPENTLRIIEISDVCVSMASLWEIAIKNSLGKLELPLPFDEIFPK